MVINIIKDTKSDSKQPVVYDLGTITTTLQNLLDNSRITITDKQVIILKVTNLDTSISYYFLPFKDYNGDTLYGYGKEIVVSDLIPISGDSGGGGAVPTIAQVLTAGSIGNNGQTLTTFNSGGNTKTVLNGDYVTVTSTTGTPTYASYMSKDSFSLVRAGIGGGGFSLKASNINTTTLLEMPNSGPTVRTLPISVNGNYADAVGNIAISAGGSGDALTTNPLSQFATTTSAQLLGIISDETGSGALTFANSPTLINPIVGTQSANDSSTKAASTAYVDAKVQDSTVASTTIAPSATAVNTALSTKENSIIAGTTSQYFRGDKTFQTLDKTSVGLSNVDNTADTAKPVSTAQQTALNLKQNTITLTTTGSGAATFVSNTLNIPTPSAGTGTILGTLPANANYMVTTNGTSNTITSSAFTQLTDNGSNKKYLSIGGAANQVNATGEGDSTSNGHMFQITNDNSTQQMFQMSAIGTVGGQNNMHFTMFDGTVASPTNSKIDKFFKSEGYRGYDGTTFTQSAGAMQVITTENWSPSGYGLRFNWEGTKTGQTGRNSWMGLDGNGISFGRAASGVNTSGYDLDLWGNNMVLGAQSGLRTRNNNQDKTFRILSIPYTIANLPSASLIGVNNSTSNILFFGGASSSYTAATDMYFYTAANNNTTTGTARGYLNPTGKWFFGGSTSGTATIHIGAGTSSTNGAPQKFTPGTLLSTIEIGAEEMSSNSRYTTTNSLNRYANGGKIYGTTTDVSNTSTTETDLVTYTTKANTLVATDESLIFDIAGTFNDATSTAQLQFYFAGQNIGNTGVVTVSSVGGWSARVIVVRSGSTTAKATVTVTTPGASTAQYTTVTSLTGITFSNTNIIKCTGTAGGATGGTGDITASVAQLLWWGASNN